MTADPPPGWCDCIGSYARTPADHTDDCPRYAPRPRGPGSTDAARTRAMAAIKAAIARAKEGHR